MLFDDFLKNLSRVRYQTRDFVTNGSEAPFMNIYEKDGNYSIKVLLPGVSKDNVDITYENGFLTLTGEKKEYNVENSELIRSETGNGKFSRVVRLTDKIDPASIKAKFNDGVLDLTMCTLPEKAPKKIAIA